MTNNKGGNTMFYRLFNELLADINYTKDDVMHMYHRINTVSYTHLTLPTKA